MECKKEERTKISKNESFVQWQRKFYLWKEAEKRVKGGKRIATHWKWNLEEKKCNAGGNLAWNFEKIRWIT